MSIKLQNIQTCRSLPTHCTMIAFWAVQLHFLDGYHTVQKLVSKR